MSGVEQSGKGMPPVIVLAGGKGTRLATIVTDRAKVMASIGGEPFLVKLIAWLTRHSVANICLGLGVKADSVVQYLSSNAVSIKENYPLADIKYCIEPEPLGTGGGLAYALHHLVEQSNGLPLSEGVVVINGDSWTNIDLKDFVAQMHHSQADVGLCAVEVEQASRYGRVDFDRDTGRLSAFVEKDSSYQGSGWINAGVYYFKPSAIKELLLMEKGSLEYDFLSCCKPSRVHVYASKAQFIDFGTVDSYQEAQTLNIQ